ncbi:NAD kinase [Lactobacillus psittaci]|uniref:NAD kinase n=1 Tax=Lactobacillus psittaci DSM 15354 TaxID=1122152 RepID=A0A0R1S3P7_9LACO|nr:NAD kinase [Lactobacillus psittaci]KRL63862.1 inorganic polyphosphate ATP-NAD kinase [Lactobacillus psittaci DSM 15354]
MKVAIVKNPRKQSQLVAQQLEKLLLDQGIEIDGTNPEVVISVGGDGTMISAFHKYQAQLDRVRFIGVHTGHLGFYTDWRNFDLKKMVQALTQEKPLTSSYPLLELIVITDNEPRHFLALNEASIKRISKTLVAKVAIKDELFETFRGDGLCVSTPTGSTAYSKSLGGAVIHPRLKALQLTEVASINNRVFRTIGSPVVIAPDEWITIEPADQHNLILIVDGKRVPVDHVQKVIYRISKQEIKFDKFGHHHFWSRVKDSFIGQVDDESF